MKWWCKIVGHRIAYAWCGDPANPRERRICMRCYKEV